MLAKIDILTSQHMACLRQPGFLFLSRHLSCVLASLSLLCCSNKLSNIHQLDNLASIIIVLIRLLIHKGGPHTSHLTQTV